MELAEQIKIQKNIELRKRIYRTIQSMYRIFRGSARDIQIVDKYMNIWKPLSNDVEDVVIFPYESKKGSMAENKNIVQCLFAMVTETIKLWHKHCRGEDDIVEALEAWLNKIDLVVKLWPDLQVRGSDVTGYYLKLPKEK